MAVAQLVGARLDLETYCNYQPGKMPQQESAEEDEIILEAWSGKWNWAWENKGWHWYPIEDSYLLLYQWIFGMLSKIPDSPVFPCVHGVHGIPGTLLVLAPHSAQRPGGSTSMVGGRLTCAAGRLCQLQRRQGHGLGHHAGPCCSLGVADSPRTQWTNWRKQQEAN